jgi:phosphotriesterase-related protein
MKSMTVLGPVDVDELGVTLMHEHLLHDDVDDPVWFAQRDDDQDSVMADAPVTMDILGELHRAPHVNRENNRLTRRDPMVDELRRFADAGGGTVVEVSTRGMMPDPTGVAEIARQTGVHVVMGTGWYVDASHPPEVEGSTADEMAARLIADFDTGIDDSDVRAGIIGEMGVSVKLTSGEEKALHAAGMAATQTGATVMVHLARDGEQAFPVFGILTGEGVAADRIVMNHMDKARNTLDYCQRVAELGCGVQFDTFGSEWSYDEVQLSEPRDMDRVSVLASLCEGGLADQLTIAHDVFWKQHLRAYGGTGFDHIPRSVVPMLRDAGMDERDLDKILVQNPKRLLALPRLSV